MVANAWKATVIEDAGFNDPADTQWLLDSIDGWAQYAKTFNRYWAWATFKYLVTTYFGILAYFRFILFYSL